MLLILLTNTKEISWVLFNSFSHHNTRNCDSVLWVSILCVTSLASSKLYRKTTIVLAKAEPAPVAEKWQGAIQFPRGYIRDAIRNMLDDIWLEWHVSLIFLQINESVNSGKYITIWNKNKLLCWQCYDNETTSQQKRISFKLNLHYRDRTWFALSIWTLNYF